MRHILIVEDDAVALKLLGDTVAGYGYVVSTASNGQEAMDQASKHEFDGVLLDVGLPDVSGLRVLEHIRHSHPTIPILIISGRKELQGQDIYDLGASDFLLKPYESDTLRKTMAQWFGT